MNQYDLAYFTRRLDQAQAAVAAAACDASRQAHTQLAAAYAKHLAIINDVPSLAA